MTTLPAQAWFVIGFIAFAAVVAALHALAVLIRNEKALRELQAEVQRIRRNSAADLDGGEDDGEVIVVDEAPAEGDASRAAA